VVSHVILPMRVHAAIVTKCCTLLRKVISDLVHSICNIHLRIIIPVLKCRKLHPYTQAYTLASCSQYKLALHYLCADIWSYHHKVSLNYKKLSTLYNGKRLGLHSRYYYWWQVMRVADKCANIRSGATVVAVCINGLGCRH
jgi:hypothetical protein